LDKRYGGSLNKEEFVANSTSPGWDESGDPYFSLSTGRVWKLTRGVVSYSFMMMVEELTTDHAMASG
jgi:hypothetical protein